MAADGTYMYEGRGRDERGRTRKRKGRERDV